MKLVASMNSDQKHASTPPTSPFAVASSPPVKFDGSTGANFYVLAVDVNTTSYLDGES